MDMLNGGCILSAWWKNALPESSTPEKEGMCLVVCVSHNDIHLVLPVLGDELSKVLWEYLSGNVRTKLDFSTMSFR